MPLKAQPIAHLHATQIEVGTGDPGYRWAPAVYIIAPDGTKLFPPVLISEARRICKREGWKIAPQTTARRCE